MADDVVGGVTDVRAGLVELVAHDPDVAWLRDKDSVVGAVQRRSAGSPDAVRRRAPVGDPSPRCGVTPDVVGHENVARRLSGDLPVRW